jgi:CMP-N,N'-diacetyllegionaminic acid synthase
VCLIPARKGSKGLPRKNLKRVGFLTLVDRAIRVARQIGYPVQIILSSDDDKLIKKYKSKVDIVIRRDDRLAQDNSSIVDVIHNAVQIHGSINDDTLFMLLEPSSPNRKAQDLLEGIEKLLKFECQALVTVSKVDEKFHPAKILRLTSKNKLTHFLKNENHITNRQDIKQNLYYKNGILYIYRGSALKTLKTTLPPDTCYVITKRHVSNIDYDVDLWIARNIYLRDLFNSLKSSLFEKTNRLFFDSR